MYFRKNETMVFRVLEIPSTRRVGSKVYYNFKNLTGISLKENI